jgi:hypothetical protein
MSKPIANIKARSVQTALKRASECAEAYGKGVTAYLSLAQQYRKRAQECTRLAEAFEREYQETAHLLALALQEKWNLEGTGREVQPC